MLPAARGELPLKVGCLRPAGVQRPHGRLRGHSQGRPADPGAREHPQVEGGAEEAPGGAG